MGVLLALLGVVGNIGAVAGAAEPLLPLKLELREFLPAPPELPEVDPLWRVTWFADLAVEEEEPVDASPAIFRWPEFSLPPADRLPVPDEEKWGADYPSRLELGYGRFQKMEAEPRFYPALARAILGVPTGLVEALASAIAPDKVIANDRQVLDQVSATDDLATIMGRTLLDAQMKFYRGLPKSDIYKLGTQLGTEEFDSRRFNRLQYRTVFTAMKNAYRERYRIPSLDLDTALATISTGDWVDFIIVPAAVSLYTARFGLDRKIRLGEHVRIELQIEKLTRFRKIYMDPDHGGRLVALSLNLFKLPLSAIVSVAGINGGVGFEFVGIGTDINSAISAIHGHEASREMRARQGE